MLNFESGSDSNASFKTWHYPIINDSERPYQQRIIETSLKKNTLVCLPTGLGKTFIGLVVMYNFHRWFPNRKIIFMAPTRPLVNQQFKSWNQLFSKQLAINAIEITGSMGPEKRHEAWSLNRIFFTTPQVLENDLSNNIIEKNSIVCVIIDEAHKAVGSYSYCTIVKMLCEHKVWFRVCALTATPGSTLSSVQNIINNLKIEKLEYVSESSEEIVSFTSRRTRQVITIPADPLIESVKLCLDEIIEKFYLMPLQKLGVFLSKDIDSLNIASLPISKNFGAVEGYLAGLRVFLHIRDLLIFYGINSMIEYISSIENSQPTPLKSRIKKQLAESDHFQRIMLNLSNRKKLPDFLSHPKLRILHQILLEHFNQSNPSFSTKAMIFSNYRESVFEIFDFLQKYYPLLRPAPLIGHSVSGNAHKNRKLNQQNTIENFIQDSHNILVTTCIGEEGLDIGFVDLIVFYDAHSSPIRLIQRSGRTGRTRDGKIIILVNEKKEKSILEHSESSSRIIDESMKSPDCHFKFEKIGVDGNAELNLPIQVVKFKLNISSKQEKNNCKRNLSFIPLTIPIVPQLDISNSLINQVSFHGLIGPSVSTEILTLITSQISKKESNKSKCLSIWRNGLKKMSVFKPYDYRPNNLEDYKFFYDLVNKDASMINSEIKLPDDFFDSEDLIFEDNSIENINNDDEINFNFDKSFDDQFLEYDFDESELKEINWSDPDF